MKFTAPLALLLSVSSAIAAEQPATAYSALRVVGKKMGAGALNRVVELRGRNGSPQPAVWKVVLSEPNARGGIREVEVQRGQIIGERTPVARGAIGAMMDFSRLNLDSEGVFTIVNKETEKGGRQFDRLDYSLRSGSGGGAPVWTVELFNGSEGKIGNMLIAADSGAVLEKSAAKVPPSDITSDRANPPPVAQEDNVYRGRESEHSAADSRHSQPGEPFRGVGDFFHRLGNRMVRRGEELENFFTGKKGGQAYDR